MDRLRSTICEECDSELLFMNGSHCAACLNALHSFGASIADPEQSDQFFDPMVGVQHKRDAEPPLPRAA
jgi:predicted amidophosphoribosyltransferase